MLNKQHLKYLSKLFALELIFLFFIRAIFIIYHSHSIVQFDFAPFIHTLLIGLIFDSAIICSSLFLLLFFQILISAIFKRINFKWFHIFASLLFSLMLIINIIDIFYFNQFGTRLTMLAVEVGVSPFIIFTTIWKSFPIGTFMGLFLLSGSFFMYLHFKIYRRLTNEQQSTSTIKFTLISFVSLILFSFLYYGKPLWTLAQFSNSSVFNQASMNGVYTFIKSCQQHYFLDTDAQSLTFSDDANALQTFRDSIFSQNDSLIKSALPSLRYLKNNDSTPFIKKNVVIIIMESFGAKYIGKLNHGIGYSPCFDSISNSGFLFTRFKSNGPRTQNGIISTVSGFPYILGINLQRRKGVSNFATLASILQNKSYDTKFIHNGNGDYDDINSFMIQAGFHDIFDVKNFKKWRYKNEWGVSDEDLYDNAFKMIWNTNNKPVLSVLMTMSNHAPHEMPLDFIQSHPEIRKMTKQQATFYYSDFALGEFFKKCRLHPQYKNTLFVILADHGEAYDPTDNECKIFHIPCLILNAKAGIGTSSVVAAQNDIPSTILGELNYSGIYHFAGQNIFAKDYTPFAFMRAYDNSVYFCRDSIMLKYYLETGKADFYTLDKQQYQHLNDKMDKKLKNSMITFTQCYMQSLSLIFRKGQYRFQNY